jgi:hypothetical protein
VASKGIGSKTLVPFEKCTSAHNVVKIIEVGSGRIQCNVCFVIVAKSSSFCKGQEIRNVTRYSIFKDLFGTIICVNSYFLWLAQCTHNHLPEVLLA